MAGANSALYFLVTTIIELVIWVFWLRVLLQAVRADFYNPVSQFVFMATRIPTDPLSKLLPPVRNINLGAVLSLFLLGVIFIYAVTALLGVRVGVLGLIGYGSLKLLLMLLGLYTFTLFIQAVMSWIGPGVHNPAANVLWSLNEPLLRPVRNVLPPIGGLDLSPLAVILALQVLSRLVPLPGVFR